MRDKNAHYRFKHFKENNEWKWVTWVGEYSGHFNENLDGVEPGYRQFYTWIPWGPTEQYMQDLLLCKIRLPEGKQIEDFMDRYKSMPKGREILFTGAIEVVKESNMVLNECLLLR